ncbi:MAG TPA: hypothetical protein VN948_16475 [Terriglobales bacterium]|nr:hypothetical protein [Terriglobales bacterium]
MKVIAAFNLVLVFMATAAALDECPQAGTYRFFSNAFLSEETGDVGGFELALTATKGHGYDALLYVYEGVANKDGISLEGDRERSGISLHGDWREELVEYPSKRHIMQTRPVKVDGKMSEKDFRGKVQIGSDSRHVSLHRVTQIWLCKH